MAPQRKTPKTKTRRKRPKAAAAIAAGEYVLVVRRGATRRYRALKARGKKLALTVVWDRRQRERRKSTGQKGRADERRRAERRQPLPFSWEVADFLLALPGRRRRKPRR